MTYLKRSNVSGKKSRAVSFLILAGLIALFLVLFLFPKAIPTALYPVTSIVWSSETGAIGWMMNMGKIARSKYSLVKENKGLRDEIASRESSMLLLDALRKENEEVKNALGRSGKGNDVLGVILSRPPISPYDTLVIDIGASEGIEKGDKVYTSGDTLIGDIDEVYEHQSKVSLFSSPGRIMPIIIGSTTVQTQAVGRGGGNFSAQLPVEIGIEEGDSIITTQIRPHAFGVVEKLIEDSSNSLQTILFKSPVNIHEFRFVEVDKGIE